ncbi:MAG: cysteine dioxygenase family protein [Phycisphaerae bacterium]|nr:cysteine dioxygenase family protein [Phycisphaerae bacterium]
MIVKTRSLADFLAELDEYACRVPLDELTARMEELEISIDDVRPFIHFGRDTYQRNLMHSGRGYSALILCWRSGQRSPIHDHRGSSCGVRIIQGVASETFFERTEHGYVYAVSTRELREGEVCGSQDGDMHQVSNLQPPGHDLVTLHVYSPPLLSMGVYSLTDTAVREFFDPVVALQDGAGI